MRAGVRAVLLDIDDTLTTDGRLTARGLRARSSGCSAPACVVVPVTGRPAGWCDHIARMWPVDAVVGENGAFYFFHDANAAAASASSDERRERAPRSARAWTRSPRASSPPCRAARSPRTSPIARPTSRSTIARTCRRCRCAAAERIAALMREAGLTAKMSSIHVNGWFGDYDKLAHDAAPVRRALRHRPRRRERARWCSPATRRTTRRCSRSSRTRSASPTCGGSICPMQAQVRDPRHRPAPGSPSSPSTSL